MSAKKPILFWVIETTFSDQNCGIVEAHVWGFDAPGTANRTLATVYLHASHSTYSQLLDAVASLIHSVNVDRTVQPNPFYPHVRAVKPSDWNTDGDVKADKLTGGAA